LAFHGCTGYRLYDGGKSILFALAEIWLFARCRDDFGPSLFATIDRRPARLPSSPGDVTMAKCSVREMTGAEPMKAKILVESAKTLLVERRELITNCLAVLALLAVGVVWA
jgi:hypothetical protein